MPRSLKICAAEGESASEMRTLGDMVASASIAVQGPRNRSIQHLCNFAIRRDVCVCWIPRLHGTLETLWLRTSRRLRQRVFALGEGPIEPEGERFDIRALHGRTAPDAQARRRIAIGVDVVGDA